VTVSVADALQTALLLIYGSFLLFCVRAQGTLAATPTNQFHLNQLLVVNKKFYVIKFRPPQLFP